MGSQRIHHATSAIGGRLLVSGGITGNNTFLATAEIYDPRTDMWTTTAPMAFARAEHRQVTFTDSQGRTKVMVLGGGNGAQWLRSTEIYDPELDRWTPGPDLNAVPYRSAVGLADGRVLTVGGYNAELYDPAANRWTTHPLPRPFDSTASLVVLSAASGHRVLAIGAADGEPAALLFDPASDTWAPTAAMAAPRTDSALTLLTDGTALATGGYGAYYELNIAERYVPAKITFPPPTPAEPTITSGPPQLSASTSATVAFSSSHPTAVVECRLDTGPYTPCTSPYIVTGLGDGVHTVDVRAVTAGGHMSTPATVTWTVDATAPLLSPTVTPNPVIVGANATAAAHASDTGSGVAAQSCPTVDVGTVGRKSITCTATDVAGNIGTGTVAYDVVFAFSGFTAPLGDPHEVNIANAGQTIPLKWRLTDATGSPVSNLASVTVTAAGRPCDPDDPVNPVTDTADSTTGLQNLGNGYYQYNWKTPTAYRHQCKQLQVDLGDGSARIALFQFR